MLVSKQAATMVQPHTLPWHEPTLKAERILMLDFASSLALAKEAAPPAYRKGDRLRSLWLSP
jgi:hypothetical protein